MAQKYLKIFKLPQIPQKITASFLLYLLSLFLFFYLLFLLYSFYLPKVNFLNHFLSNLDKTHYHVAFIKKLINLNQLTLARSQIKLNLSLRPQHPQILSLQKNLYQIEKTPQKLNQEIKKYEQITKIRPNYRDGFFKLALLHYQLYQDKKAKKYLQKTLSLDPNFSPALKFKNYLSF